MLPSPFYTDAAASFSTWNNVWIAVFTEGLREPHLDVLARMHAKVVAAHPVGALAVVIVEPGAFSLPTPLRAPLVPVLRTIDQTLLMGAQIFPGGHIVQTMLQSAVKLTTRRRKPSKTFRGVSAATVWLIQHANATHPGCANFTSQELYEAVKLVEDAQLRRAKGIASTETLANAREG